MATRPKLGDLPPSNAYSRFYPRSTHYDVDLTQITTLEDLERLNSGIVTESRGVDERLADLFKHRDAALSGQRVIFNEQLPGYLVPLVSDSSRLERSLEEASNVAEKVSRKIRAVDVIRKRAVEASQRARDAITLRHCVEGVQGSLKAGQYEEAVKHMAVYLRFEEAVVDSETKSIMSVVQEQVLSALRQQLSQAIASNSISEMTRLTKLFSPLGMFDEGVRHYASYLEKQINNDLQTLLSQAQESMKSAQEKGTGEKASYAAAISQLISRAHARLKRAKPILEQAFGASGLLHAVLILQPIITSHCCTLIDDFGKSWNQFSPQIKEIENSAAAAEQAASTFLSFSSYASANPLVSKPWNPLEFAPLLDQLVVICQTLEVHCRFLSAVIVQGRDSISKEITALEATERDQIKPAVLGKRMSATELNLDHRASSVPSEATKATESTERQRLEKVRMQIEDYARKLESSSQLGPQNERLIELLSHYMRFEQYYMKQSVKNVLAQEAVAGDEGKSSLVDDVFFLLKESSNRARATYNANTICAVVNFIDSVLNDEYYQAIEERSSREALQAARTASSLASAPNYPGAQSPSARNVLIAINQIEQTALYITRLKTDLEEPSKRIFALLPHDLDKVLTCCEELLRTEAKYRQLINTQLDQIAEAIKPRFLGVFEIIAQASYKLNHAEYSQNQINDPFAQKLIHGISDIIAPIEHVLSPTNTMILVSIFMKLLVRQFERHIIKQPFTQLGAEQLDRDIRAFAEYFSQRTPVGVSRDVFHRLSQIAYLLGLDSLEEVQDEWNLRIAKRTELDKPAWALSPTDAKRVLILRTDFPKEKVADRKSVV